MDTTLPFPIPTDLDLATGIIAGERVKQGGRKLSDMLAMFGDAAAAHAMLERGDDPPIYDTYTWPGIDGAPADQMLYATTVLHPGRVGDEYFMTRGHFHVRPERGEFTVTLGGSGALVLMDRDRHTRVEWMQPGSIHMIDGRLAHRVANVGPDPLTFLVCWQDDCGHDYAAIAERGYSARVREVDGKPTLVWE